MTARADVFVCDTNAFNDDDVRDLLPLLSDDERDRHSNLGFADDRRDYVVGHALLRISLAARVGVPARQLQFDATPYGKPVLSLSRPGPTTSFSLAHAHGIVACAISDASPVGVDVDTVRADTPALDIARLWFAPAEIESLANCTGDERAARFCELWTLKEAYSKAVGLGLGQSLREPWFEVGGDGVRCTGASQWHFHLETLARGHKLAVAAHRGVEMNTRHLQRATFIASMLSLPTAYRRAESSSPDSASLAIRSPGGRDDTQIT